MKAQSRNDLVSAVLMTTLGVLFIVLKAEVIQVAMTIFGALLILQAVLDLIARQLVMAVIKGVIGVAVIVFGWLIVDVATIIFAIVLLIFGLLQLIESIKALPTASNMLAKVLGFVKPGVCIAIAVCLLVNAGSLMNALFIVAGVFFILQGVVSLVDCFATRK